MSMRAVASLLNILIFIYFYFYSLFVEAVQVVACFLLNIKYFTIFVHKIDFHPFEQDTRSWCHGLNHINIL